MIPADAEGFSRHTSVIDVLKVDVEGAELSVLRGIRPDHWAIVQQVRVATYIQYNHTPVSYRDGVFALVVSPVSTYWSRHCIADDSRFSTCFYGLYCRWGNTKPPAAF